MRRRRTVLPLPAPRFPLRSEPSRPACRRTARAAPRSGFVRVALLRTVVVLARTVVVLVANPAIDHWA
ncbi:MULTISPECIES: hypothetical protein [unclassified Streptomyces]|uniref:hypothetical protein n=1 Tax=unclassified Streptomyces TaxID=2593676 RepID=UPI00224DF33E|nr:MULTISPECIES: hypothetical protein [unclassified Streptomyces]MCX5437193.1 hypothetical protein [Streptomyces sp. NBC_00063]WSE14894.1 hypothetical protein OG518_16995 [Streptomyces sp. NBC_01397]WUB96190.1 hypothetical protein OHO83_30000 [Streptomyces sp. NBC_00569]